MKNLTVDLPIQPELDPGFLPAALWNRAYRKLAAASPDARPVAIAMERSNGAVSRIDAVLLPETAEHDALNFRFIERMVKFMLWAYGGSRVTVAGAPRTAAKLREVYSASGARSFDADVMGRRIYGGGFTILSCDYADAPPEKKLAVKLGGNFGGCRIGFDLGGSDRKCAAVIDGRTVHSEEVVWDPYFQHDVEYHRQGIIDSLRRAAAKLPRVDAIGGSAAGVYVDNQPKIASLFRGIPEADFPAKVQPIFRQIAEKEFPGVPFVVLNDGEVTALAGALSMHVDSLIGLAMGTSEAVGFVTPEGTLTDYLNELAFAPVDYREDAPVDEWSGDTGVGALYLSQQAVGRLVRPAGMEIPGGTPLPEVLRMVQRARAEGDPRASAIYRTVGVYLGYAVAHYADFYPVKNLLLLGRVSSGDGGSEIIAEASRVLREVFPEIPVKFHLPDETFKRHGQAVIAASL